VRRLIAAQWISVRSHRLGRCLLAVLLIVLLFQLRGKAERLTELATLLSDTEALGLEHVWGPASMESWNAEARWLRENLRFPAVIGYGVRLATGLGWFLLIGVAAVMVGQDFTRGTLGPILARGVGRARCILARFLSLWIAAGVAILAIIAVSAVVGAAIHSQVCDDPMSLDGLGDALLMCGRVWLASAPFVLATLFWAVLAGRTASAMTVALGVHLVGFLLGHMIPPALAGTYVAPVQLSPAYLVAAKLSSVTLGYCADALLRWGLPIVVPMNGLGAFVVEDQALLPASPWRALALLCGYSLLFLGWAVWVLRRRDLTTEA
jgi:ABC-type transport system involved in multi-copper enzyme maturation permease subunit